MAGPRTRRPAPELKRVDPSRRPAERPKVSISDLACQLETIDDVLAWVDLLGSEPAKMDVGRAYIRVRNHLHPNVFSKAPPLAKEAAMLHRAIRRVDVPLGQLLFHVLADWRGFTEYVTQRVGFHAVAPMPRIEYLSKYIDEAGLFAQTKVEATGQNPGDPDGDGYAVPGQYED